MKINFVQEFLAIQKECRDNGLPARERLLWLAIFTIANERSRFDDATRDYEWPDDWFPISNAELQLYATLDKRGVEHVREALKQRGYIDYVPGMRNTAQPKYRLNYLTAAKVGDISGCNSVPSFDPNNVPNEPAFGDNVGCKNAPLIYKLNIGENINTSPIQTGAEEAEYDAERRRSMDEVNRILRSEWTVPDGAGGLIDLETMINQFRLENINEFTIRMAFDRARRFFAEHPSNRVRTYSMAARYLRGVMDEINVDADGLPL